MRPIKLTENTISKKNINSFINWLKKNPRLTKGDLTLKFEKLLVIGLREDIQFC